MAYFTKKNAKIFYELYGDGEKWITFINGYTRPSSDFKLLGSFMAEHGRRVLTFDNRGSGKTEVALDFSVEDIVRDVTELWDELKISKTSVLGISMGGFIAQILATTHPERVQSLCLVSTTSNLSSFPERFEWPKKEDEIVERLKKYFHPEFAKKNILLIQAMAKQIAKDNENGSFDSKARAQSRAMQGAHLDLQKLSKLSIPCLIIHGRQDEIIPIKEAEILHQRIPNSKLHIYEDTGHILLMEQRNDFYARVNEFVSAS